MSLRSPRYAGSVGGSEPPNATTHWRWFEVEFLTDIERTITDIAGELAELHEQPATMARPGKAGRKGLSQSPRPAPASSPPLRGG